MIYTVTFNPALDYIMWIPQLNIDGVNRAENSVVRAGGKGVNVSLVLKNLGHENTALGFAAGFTGNQLIKELTDRGCSADFITLERGMTRINVKIKGGYEAEINGQGPEIPERAVQALKTQLKQVRDGDILVLSGSIPDSLSPDMYERIMAEQQGKDVKVAVDATNDLLLNVLKYHPFLIKPNHHELGEIFHASVSNKKEAVYYGEKLREMGAVNVLISMAGEGAVLLDENGGIYESPAPEGQVVNSVGAGDSMVAGFIAGYLETGNYEKAFQMGLAAGSASAFSEGLATRKETEDLLRKTFEGQEEKS